MKKKILLFVLLFFGYALSHAQYKIPSTPEDQTSIYDYINLLSEQNERSLKVTLLYYSLDTDSQIVFVIISSTRGEDILELATRWGQKWGIGKKGEDNGILLLMAKEDRKVAIATGKGIEKRLTDEKAKKIIDAYIIPNFKKGKYAKGLEAGASGIHDVLKRQFGRSLKERRENQKYFGCWHFFY